MVTWVDRNSNHSSFKINWNLIKKSLVFDSVNLWFNLVLNDPKIEIWISCEFHELTIQMVKLSRSKFIFHVQTSSALWDKGLAYLFWNFYLIKFWNRYKPVKCYLCHETSKSNLYRQETKGKTSFSSKNLSCWFLLFLLKWLIFNTKVNFGIF